MNDTSDYRVIVLDGNKDGNANDPVVVLDTKGAIKLTNGNHQAHLEITPLVRNVTTVGLVTPPEQSKKTEQGTSATDVPFSFAPCRRIAKIPQPAECGASDNHVFRPKSRTSQLSRGVSNS